MQKILAHYSQHTGAWPWSHFSPAEMACKHCGELFLAPWAMDTLEDLRLSWGHPIIITSAHRCEKHNKAVGGTPNSQHLTIAFDCRCPKEKQALFVKMAKRAGFTGIGRYPLRGFVHVDCGPKREWEG